MELETLFKIFVIICLAAITILLGFDTTNDDDCRNPKGRRCKPK